MESSQGITEIEQVSTHSIQVYWGPMGVIAWNPFVLRVEHDYIIVSKSEKFLDMGELTFHAEITTLPIAAVNHLLWQTTL